MHTSSLPGVVYLNYLTPAGELLGQKSAEYTYMPTGAIKSKKLGEQSAGQFAEATDYVYTPRDWLRGLNVVNDIFEIDPGNPTAAFAMLLNYHNGPGTPRYNGDITAASYFTKRSGSAATPQGSRFHRYIFSYDDLSRLTEAEYHYSDNNSSWNANSGNAFDLSSVSFDAVGNITSLSRKDESGSGAAFNYHYKNNNTNWLDWVENLRSQTAGNYDYDGDGNLVQDVSKDLVSITYDYRDLPTKLEFNLPADLVLDLVNPITGTRTYRALQTITTQNNFVVASGGDVTFIAGQRIELKPGFAAQQGSQFHAQIDPNIGSQPGNVLSFTYNQKGERIKKHSDTNGTLYYIRGVDGQTVALLSENDTPLFYNIANVGRLLPGSPAVSYYYLTDHLGSIRVIVDESGNVVGYTDYYPFGMQIPGRVMSSLSHDFYKYNAKQLDNDYGLNWHDYSWRPYDAEIGRFFKIDRFAEKYPSLSSYQYAANNPVLIIDVNGDSLWIKYKTGFLSFLGIGKTNTVLYENGKLYNKDGTEFTGKVSGFLKKNVDALGRIGSAQEGATMLQELQSSTNSFFIEKAGKSEFVPFDKNKAYANQIRTDPAGASQFAALQQASIDLSGGSGGTIYWNISGMRLATTSGILTNPTIDLGHEMFHALDSNRGLLDQRLYQNIRRSEWQASYRENILRRQLGVPLRTHYRKLISGHVITGLPPALLSPDNQPILPFWYTP